MASLIPCYIASKLASGDRVENLHNASLWAGFLSRRYAIEPVCPWITLASVWTEADRDLGLEIDRAAIERVNAAHGIVALCGAEVSMGIRAESWWADTVVDITQFGHVTPDLLNARELEELDAMMALRWVRRRDG